eukprot:PhM_4_TR118/c0_g2_i1/m.54590/K12589/RRP42, EXOSC7; exosome complex component RRP42
MQGHISGGERSFILNGIAQDVRTDGRGRLQWRPFHITHGVVGRAHGSAHVTLGGTEVVVGVYGDVQPSPEGSLSFHVDCTPAAVWSYNPTSQGRPMAKQTFTSGIAHQLAMLYGANVASRVKDMTVMATEEGADGEEGNDAAAGSLLYPSAASIVDLSPLSLPSNLSWSLNVDVMVVGCTGGNVLGASAIAVKAALMNVRLPRVEVSGNGEVTLHPDTMQTIATARDYPIATVFMSTGSYFCVDPTLEEENTPHTAVALGVRPDGATVLCQTISLSSRITSQGPMQPQDVLCVLQDGVPVLCEMNA